MRVWGGHVCGAVKGCVLALSLLASPVAAERVTVFAAASLGDVLNEAAVLWAEPLGHDLAISVAGSSAAARQVAAGAPADLVILASSDWMDWLAAQGIGTDRRDLAGNALVIVARGAGIPQPLDNLDWEARLGSGRLAIALTQAVPAGIYGRAALTHLGVWPRVETRLAEVDNVRAALALVALGAAPLGLVYASDAQAGTRVHVVAQIPTEAHDPITYPAALVSDNPAAADLLAWLSGPQGQALFQRHGFLPPPAQ